MPKGGANCSERGQRRKTRKLLRSDQREVSWPTRASRWATIPTANATDIVPIRFSAASAAVHLAWPAIPDHARPRALLKCTQMMVTTTLVASRVRISGRRRLARLIRPARARALSVFCLDRLFCGRVYERPVGQHMRTRRKLRGIDLTAPHDVHDRNALRQQIVGNDAAVATPPHGFSAHDRTAIVTGERSQLVQSCSESVRCRVIGIVPEGGDMPERIERSWRPLFPVPQPAKSGQMSIMYSHIAERSGESIGVKLWIRPRARDRTHIDKQIDTYLLKQSQEFIDRTR